MELDIVILPKRDLRRRLGLKILNAAKGVSSRFLVDGKKLQHHMSLYHIKISTKKLDELISRVGAIAEQETKFRIKSKVFAIHAGGVMSLDFERSRGWEKLQSRLVRACAALRNGVVAWPYERRPDKKEAGLRRKYGSSFLYPLMKPHFTMGRLAEGESGQKILQTMRRVKVTFIADTLAVCKTNNDHQVIRILKTFKLK